MKLIPLGKRLVYCYWRNCLIYWWKPKALLVVVLVWRQTISSNHIHFNAFRQAAIVIWCVWLYLWSIFPLPLYLLNLTAFFIDGYVLWHRNAVLMNILDSISLCYTVNRQKISRIKFYKPCNSLPVIHLKIFNRVNTSNLL